MWKKNCHAFHRRHRRHSFLISNSYLPSFAQSVPSTDSLPSKGRLSDAEFVDEIGRLSRVRFASKLNIAERDASSKLSVAEMF